MSAGALASKLRARYITVSERSARDLAAAQGLLVLRAQLGWWLWRFDGRGQPLKYHHLAELIAALVVT